MSKNPDWIKTADNLPANNAAVWFVYEGRSCAGHFSDSLHAFVDMCGVMVSVSVVSHWQPRYIPAPPTPDPSKAAFKAWCDSVPAATGLTECWKAAEAYGRTEERSRFAEGVEKIISERIANENISLVRFISDLRALAKGDK